MGENDSVPVKLAESAAYTRASARLQPGRSKRMRVVAGGSEALLLLQISQNPSPLFYRECNSECNGEYTKGSDVVLDDLERGYGARR